MTLNWQGNTRITIGGTSKTPQGFPPTLCTFQSKLYLVYIGQSGVDLYYSWLPSGDLGGPWQGNIKINVNGHNLKSYTDKSLSQAASLCVVAGILHMVYTGSDGASLYWSWFDGVTWYGALPLFAGSPIPKAEAALAAEVEGDILHLVYANNGNLYYSSCDVGNPDPTLPWAASDWTPQTPVASADNGLFQSPSLAFSSGLALAARFGAAGIDHQIYAAIASPPSWNLNPLTPSEGATSPVALYGPTMVRWDDVLYLVYLGPSQKYMWYCTLDSHGALLENWEITAASTPETRGRPAAAVFDEQLCIAYTGENSDNLYFAYSDNLPPLTITVSGRYHPF